MDTASSQSGDTRPFHPLQLGFCCKHSCSALLAQLTDLWSSDLSKDVFLDLKKKAFDLVDHKILLSKLLNSLPFSVHTLKIQYSVSLFVVPTLLKELLNMVYQKGQSWLCLLYSSSSILTIYLYIYHQTLPNVICSHMTQHFIQQVKVFLKHQYQ